jgi:hypothetical protein
MEKQHESDLVKRLEQLGIAVDVSPSVTMLTYEQIYTSGATLEEASVTFLSGRNFEQVRGLAQKVRAYPSLVCRTPMPCSSRR